MIDNTRKEMLIDALKRFAENPDAIENLDGYLDRHFSAWCEKYANNPESFIWELDQFSRIE